MGESANTKDTKATRSRRTANGFINFDRVNAVRGQSSTQPVTPVELPTVTTEQALPNLEQAPEEYKTPESAKVVRFPFVAAESTSVEDDVAGDHESTRAEDSRSADGGAMVSLGGGKTSEDAVAFDGEGEARQDPEASAPDMDRTAPFGEEEASAQAPQALEPAEGLAAGDVVEPTDSSANEGETTSWALSEGVARVTPEPATTRPPTMPQVPAVPLVSPPFPSFATPERKRLHQAPTRPATARGRMPTIPPAVPVLPKKTTRAQTVGTPGDGSESAEIDILLRIGISREMHARLVAFAKMGGLSSTQFARELLEQHVPVFRSNACLAELARTARNAFPSVRAEDARAETRMQVPLSDDLYRRVHQLAALRSQPLKPCVMDLLEAHIPEM